MSKWDYISFNPMVWALIETLVFMLICTGWVLIFVYSLDGKPNDPFPVSIHPFYFMLTITLFILFMNYHERSKKYRILEKIKDSPAPNEALLSRLYQRYSRTGRGLNALCVFAVYAFLLSLPWGLWGYYRKLSVIPFLFIAWCLLALMRYVNAIATDFSAPNRFYFDPKSPKAISSK